MGLEYLKITPEIMLKISAYGEEEQGRLILAMIAYALDGTETQFDGMERFIWPTLKMDIERCAASVEKQAANGNKGGRPPKNETQAKPKESQAKPNESQAKPKESQAKPKESQAKPNETQAKPNETQAKPNETQAKPNETQAKPNETQAKPKETLNTNTNINTNTNNQEKEVSNTRAREEEATTTLGMTDDELLEIRKAQAEVETAARRVGLPVDELVDMDSMNKLIAEHGADNTIKAIDKLAGKTKETRCWNYVAGILRKEKSSGYSWREKPETSKDYPLRGVPWKSEKDVMQRHSYTPEQFKTMVTDLDAENDSGKPKGKDGDVLLRYSKEERKANYSAAIIDFDEEE